MGGEGGLSRDESMQEMPVPSPEKGGNLPNRKGSLDQKRKTEQTRGGERQTSVTHLPRRAMMSPPRILFNI